MKSTPRRRRQQASQPHQQAAASLAPHSNEDGVAVVALGAAYAVRAGKTKHGPRNWGKQEYAQAAIAERFPTVLPKYINQLQLFNDVKKILNRDPDWRASCYKISRMTVVRALQALRAANR